MEEKKTEIRRIEDLERNPGAESMDDREQFLRFIVVAIMGEVKESFLGVVNESKDAAKVSFRGVRLGSAPVHAVSVALNRFGRELSILDDDGLKRFHLLLQQRFEAIVVDVYSADSVTVMMEEIKEMDLSDIQPL